MATDHELAEPDQSVGGAVLEGDVQELVALRHGLPAS